MEVLYKGAEANIYQIKNRLIKERIKKKYRVDELDDRLRKTRTRREARLLEKALRAGVSVPRVYKVEGEKIEMEYIKGEPLINKHVPKNMELAKSLGIDNGLFTNGILMTPDIITTIVKSCTWIRISLGAVTPETFKKSQIKRITSIYGKMEDEDKMAHILRDVYGKETFAKLFKAIIPNFV